MPLAIDLYAGLGGWSDGLLAEGWDVIGFDIERHEYWLPKIESDGDGGKGTRPVEKRGWTQGCAISLGMEGAASRPRTRLARYPAQLVIQDVLTLHGSQFRGADLIVASPPCQEFSWMAMPWSRAKQVAAALRGKGEFPEGYRGSRTVADLTRLFDACFRIQREASAAAGRHIPMVVENVRGAQPWVWRARWNYGSFYLWGDVPALMPGMLRGKEGYKPQAFNGSAARAHNTTSGKGNNPDGRKAPAGTRWFNDAPRTPDSLASSGSKSPARKAASALIAKIPKPLARWIARAYYPASQMRAHERAA